MGRSRYKITDPYQTHYVTLTVLHWIPVFTRPEIGNILLDLCIPTRERGNERTWRR